MPKTPPVVELPDWYDHRRTRQTKEATITGDVPVPWMTYPAIAYLSQLDLSAKRVFEYGSGSSTRFWAANSLQVTTVENDKAYYERLAQYHLRNVTAYLAQGEEYVAALRAGAPYDVIVVDGRWRYDCCCSAPACLVDDGLIILDNAERYPKATAFLRSQDLLQVDFIGHGPINSYIWSTSLFFTRNFRFPTKSEIVPHMGPGMLDSIEANPTFWKGNQLGSPL
jgi:hypothetical protein